jgi:hypothetical protein
MELRRKGIKEGVDQAMSTVVDSSIQPHATLATPTPLRRLRTRRLPRLSLGSWPETDLLARIGTPMIKKARK